MYEHLKNIEFLYGENVSVQIPNGLFEDLSSNIMNKNNSTNIQQASFAYTYLVILAFLYKYAHFVDVDNRTYIQNADIKEMLGYNRLTKTIDNVIKNNGVLDKIGLTRTTKNFPIRFIKHPRDRIESMAIRDYIYIKDISCNDINYNIIKDIVKNRNYTIKEPLFLFEYNGDSGTLYNYANTHKITINELMTFIYDDTLDNIDFYIYCFIKSKCYGLKENTKPIGLHIITSELGISKDAFYNHLNIVKEKGYIAVNHKGWVMVSEADSLEANEYCFKGM